MSVSRRQFLSVAAGAAALSPLGLAACNGGGGGGGGGSATEGTLAFTWWGNDLRNKMTDEVIKAYMEANPDVTINPQVGEWSSYWDKLATQTAGNSMPDVVQMDMAYISEYGERGALLDLSDLVDTSNFQEGTVESGRVGDELVGINAGINSLSFMSNPEIFDELGVEMPDDTTWTWDDYREISAELTAKGGKDVTGSAGFFGTDNLFQIWLRQNDADMFTAEGGLGFTVDHVAEYFELMMSFADEKAIPSPQAIQEEAGMSMDQTAFAQGNQGFALYWSNQLAAINDTSGRTNKMLRPPTVAGDASQRNGWYKASMLWSVSARTEHPEAAAAYVDWLVNTEDAASILLDERGLPPNTEIRSAIEDKLTEDGQASAQFIADIEPEVGETPVPPPPGGGTFGDTFTRFADEVMFGRQEIQDAADQCYSEIESNLQ